MRATKLSIETPDAALARTLASAFENLAVPSPDAVTQFEDAAGAWRIEAYFSNLPDVLAITQQLTLAAGRAVPPLGVAEVPDLNWVALSQAALPPVAAGRFIVHGSHDRARVPHGPHALEIDAGEAFGTAHHATTLGCLMAIDRLARVLRPRRVLDLGCGSGVLAIAAARALPGAEILATDSDPRAVAVAADNARVNGLGQRIAFACASGLAHPWLRHAAPFDLIVANILAGPLCDLAPDVRRATRRGGALVLSGLLDREAARVIAAYAAQGFCLAEHRRFAGWSTLVMRRRAVRVAEAAKRRPCAQPTIRIAVARRGA